MWSFVVAKSNKQWIWLAIDAKTREIVGVHIGDRSREGAKKLWQSLPSVYRQCAVCYSDFWEAYEQVIPSKRHRAVGKETGKTNYIERFNCTLRILSVALSQENFIFFQKDRKSYWSNLVFCPSLQCILTSLGLPRIVIEHVYRSLKIFRILSERYRNRRTRFSLRFNLIAGIYNYELSLSQNS